MLENKYHGPEIRDPISYAKNLQTVKIQRCQVSNEVLMQWVL